ncbi:MAG: homoserine kinase [Chloroflexi bacterium]|nr:homoserine kinase [Chloroflexota bacterium]MBU1748622.1 homoserine kinase [Chloroflexota bacterium]MBU1877385.1 homoserine kinase [Chloroflexota bacterium]
MATYTRLQADDIHEITGRYDMTVVDFEPIEGGAGNSSYLLRTRRRGRHVLTVFDDQSPNHATWLGQLLTWLTERGFPTTTPVPTTRGHLITMHGAKPVMVKVYVTGQVHRHLDEAMLRQVGAAMAQLHQIPAPDFLPDRVPYGVQAWSNITGRNVDPEYETWAARRLGHFERVVPRAAPRGLIHGDLFYDNVLFVDGELAAVIDFEDAQEYYQAFDLGMGIVGMCSRGPAVALDKARALVDGYQQIRTLREREKAALQLFCEFAATTVSCWRFWKYHIDKPTVTKADKHWQMVRLAEAIRAIPQPVFIEAVLA